MNFTLFQVIIQRFLDLSTRTNYTRMFGKIVSKFRKNCIVAGEKEISNAIRRDRFIRGIRSSRELWRRFKQT